jgi:hypothetical protein
MSLEFNNLPDFLQKIVKAYLSPKEIDTFTGDWTKKSEGTFRGKLC